MEEGIHEFASMMIKTIGEQTSSFEDTCRWSSLIRKRRLFKRQDFIKHKTETHMKIFYTTETKSH
jgi:hypothetical protein